MDEKLQMRAVWAQGASSSSKSVLGATHASPSIFFMLLPSFVVNYFRPDAAMKLPKQHPTSYLDGLRGLAAFIVYAYHFALMWTKQDLEIGYGSPLSLHYWYQRPLIRLLIAGRASITVFFVISGYVLSVRTLGLIHANKHDKILAALSSSVFRRPFRLFLPIAAATAILAVLVQIGFPFLRDHVYGAGIAFTAVSAQHQFVDWLGMMGRLVNPYTIVGAGRRGEGNRVALYIGPTWTIPTEYKGSIAVFLMLLVFCRARRGVAMAATLVVGVAWQLHIGDADNALFMAGLFLAELYHVVPPSSIPPLLARLMPGHDSRVLHSVHHAVTMVLFFASLWLLSTPVVDVGQTPGYKFLTGLAPSIYTHMLVPDLGIATMEHLFWLSTGSILLVLSLMYAPPRRLGSAERGSNSYSAGASTRRPADEESQQGGHPSFLFFDSSLGPAEPLLGEEDREKKPDHHHHHNNDQAQNQVLPHQQPLLHRLFTNRLAQYLGAISYSLYLLHEAINHTIGSRWAVPATDLWMQYDEIFNLSEEGRMVAQQVNALSAFRWKYWSWYAVSFFFNTIVLIWASDLFMRAVDAPSVRFARWISRFVESNK